MEVINFFLTVWVRLNKLTLPILAIGLMAVGIFNYYLLRRAATILPSKLPDAMLALKAAPDVTALVPAWNEAGTIEAHIRSFKKLRYPHKELILIAGGNDHTFNIASQYADEEVRVIPQQPGKGKQVALRDGLQHVTGDIIYLSDADCLFDDDSFERTLAPLINDNWPAATGASKSFDHQLRNPLVAFQVAVDQWALINTPDPSPGLMGRNCAIQTYTLKQSGGFDAPAPTGTDYTLARQLIRQGYTIKNVKQSLIESEYPSTLKLYYHKRSRWLRNVIVIGFTTRDYALLFQALRGSLQGGFLLAAPLAAFVLGSVWFVLWLIVISHALFSRIRYIVLARYSVPVEKETVAIIAGLMLPVDLWIWATAFLQVFDPNARSSWH